ncbi:hypothetical protein K8Z61_13000 [Nocardioides sp. TRM66260-LWL]|uniref:hypothetical protein n=1 Tax=Nocardioides sp. TRM66260-LWL TaxID=2874478 RepID=UPI001CC5A54E|nr:hypothetical protein [Nocardioides sp. TRM66260-LWL]MBZ5735416.1 hypothetical protein [Nocardioides sp. TRM66260-LWL]
MTAEPRRREGRTGPIGRRDAYLVPDALRVIRGGSGVVYRAVLDAGVAGMPAGTAVGLKALTAIDEDRFRKVADRSARIPRHPNLAHHLETFLGPPVLAAPDEIEEDDHVFYSSHVWVEGRLFSEAILTASPAQVRAWARDVAEGLDALHAAPSGGLAHRDVHGRNVVVTPEGHAVLLDFEAVLWGDDTDTSMSALTSVPSDVAESAPGLRGAQQRDRALLAVLLLRGLARDASGTMPFDEVRDVARRTLEELVADADGALAGLWAAACGRAPGSAVEIVEALDRPNLRPAGAVRGGRRHRVRAGVLAAAVVVAVAAGVGVGAEVRPHVAPTASTADPSGSAVEAGAIATPGSSRSSRVPRSRPPSSAGASHLTRASVPGGGQRTRGTATPGASPATAAAVPVRTPSVAAVVAPSRLPSPSSSPSIARPGSPASTHVGSLPSSSPSSVPPGRPAARLETSGSEVHTWSDYRTAGGRPGVTMDVHRTVEITCRVEGFAVQDGNTWWYRIRTAPWSDEFYGSADAFYNNGSTSGSLHGTPFVDESVPLC